MRILVTITPRMYREAIAGYLLQHRPGYEVRSSAPADAEEEVILFAPHLLVHDDTDGLDPGVLEASPVGWRCSTATAWARGSAWTGAVEENPDISTEVLLRVADEAAAGMREP